MVQEALRAVVPEAATEGVAAPQEAAADPEQIQKAAAVVAAVLLQPRHLILRVEADQAGLGR